MEKMELVTYREYNGLGTQLDKCIKELIDKEYGVYSIDEEDIRIMTIVANMTDLQEHFNKGLKLIGWEGKQRKIEVYDYKKRKEMIFNLYDNLNI